MKSVASEFTQAHAFWPAYPVRWAHFRLTAPKGAFMRFGLKFSLVAADFCLAFLLLFQVWASL